MASFTNKNWTTPPHTYFKMNADCAFQPTNHNSSFDGLIWDENDDYCSRFYGNLGADNVFFVEVRVILHSIRVT